MVVCFQTTCVMIRCDGSLFSNNLRLWWWL